LAYKNKQHWHVTPYYYSDVECDSGTVVEN
jgi:hypothetical protein